jgi:hypothetical protein
MTGSRFADGRCNAEPRSFTMNFLHSSVASLSPCSCASLPCQGAVVTIGRQPKKRISADRHEYCADQPPLNNDVAPRPVLSPGFQWSRSWTIAGDNSAVVIHAGANNDIPGQGAVLSSALAGGDNITGVIVAGLGQGPDE